MVRSMEKCGIMVSEVVTCLEKQGGCDMPGKTRTCISILCLLAFAANTLACGQVTSPPPPTTGTGNVTALPPPAQTGDTSLEEVLAQRRSVREFSDQPLTETELGQLLWAAQGITSERGLRTAPSAGAIYPLEVYLATSDGVFQYDPQTHSLLVSSHDDARPKLYQAALKQEPIRKAPAVFILTAIYERTAKEYGTQRSTRYVHLEAGHAAQNLLLQAVALDLGAVSIGAFDDQEIRQVLGLSSDYTPLYLIPVGHRASP
jgi:SagB-type dehydrogenase family enzyme